METHTKPALPTSSMSLVHPFVSPIATCKSTQPDGDTRTPESSATLPTTTSPKPPPISTTHPWSAYTPYTLPKPEIRRLRRVVAAHISVSLRALTLEPGTYAPSAYDVQQFVDWVCRQGDVDPTVLVVIVHYLRTFVASNRDVVCNWYYVVAAALLVASKIVDDDSCDNHEVAGFLCDYLFGTNNHTMYADTLKTLNQWEYRLVVSLEYRVHMLKDAYTEMWQMLAEGTPVATRQDHLTTSPTSVTSVSSLVPCSKPHPTQLLRNLCTATVRGWFAGLGFHHNTT